MIFSSIDYHHCLANQCPVITLAILLFPLCKLDSCVILLVKMLSSQLFNFFNNFFLFSDQDYEMNDDGDYEDIDVDESGTYLPDSHDHSRRYRRSVPKTLWTLEKVKERTLISLKNQLWFIFSLRSSDARWWPPGDPESLFLWLRESRVKLEKNTISTQHIQAQSTPPP